MSSVIAVGHGAFLTLGENLILDMYTDLGFRGQLGDGIKITEKIYEFVSRLNFTVAGNKELRQKQEKKSRYRKPSIYRNNLSPS